MMPSGSLLTSATNNSASTPGRNAGPGTAAASINRKRQKRAELSEDQRLEVKEAFELFDTDKTGSIGFHELKVCLKAFGFDVKKKDILELRREYDQKQTGRIDYVDFSDILSRKIADRDPIDEIKKAFRLFDDDGTESAPCFPRVGKSEVLHVPGPLSRDVKTGQGEGLTDDELQAMIDEFDQDNDGESEHHRILL